MLSLAPSNLAADLWSIVRPCPSPSKLLEAIHAAARALRQQSDAGLKSAADDLRAAVRKGADGMQCRAVLVPAFALVLESTRRVHGITLFDTQLLAGMAMARGAIAEMATGEGKTLAAALPAMLLSLRGPGVHVATPNAYLAQRDYEQVAPILQLLGTSVGLVPEAGTPSRSVSEDASLTLRVGVDQGNIRTPLAPREEFPLAEREDYLNGGAPLTPATWPMPPATNWASTTSAINFRRSTRPGPAWASGSSNCSAAGPMGNRWPSSRGETVRSSTKSTRCSSTRPICPWS